ncbi:hypothetical protein [Flavitalea sp.]|nr:hypothetical protein [Flavitalea sp.]
MTAKDNADVSPIQECAGSQVQSGLNQTGSKQTDVDPEKNFIVTNVDELMSDGSASAFEGTESIGSREQDLDIKRKEEQLKNDPSGRRNY